MKKHVWIFAVLVLVLASLACNAIAGGAPEAENTPSGETQPEPTAVPSGGNEVEPTATVEEAVPSKYDTEFPLPGEVSNFISTGDGGINFQTKMSLKDALAFYRDEFTKAGYKEREITTVISDQMFSLVFDGHANGKAIVIQALDMGDGTINVNLRFEDI